MSACHLVCVSHGPALARPNPAPREHAAVEAAYEARARALQAFAPDLVIMFAPDHYTGVHLQLVPPFCVGLACESVADYGGFPGRFAVPEDTAWACIEALRAAEFDVAVSYAMTVDHGFSQPLHRLAGALDRYPVVPILINAICRPAASFRRVRKLGEAVGAFARGLGCRVAFLASGGLSHHPVNVFPQDLASADPALRDYLTYGGGKGEMSRAGWVEHMSEMTRLGGERVKRGEMVAADFRINPEWDREFLRLFAAGDLTAFDAWRPEEVIAQAGVAAIEVQQWIAAAAAARAMGCGPPVIDLYVAAVEYRLAVGVAHADGPCA